MAKHLLVVEIFQTDQLTEQNWHLLINAASTAKKKHMNAFVSQEKQLYFHLCEYNNTQISQKFHGKKQEQKRLIQAGQKREQEKEREA